MRKQKSLNNKGFSLVELIIVIAIMAILVGVLAPNLLRYLDRADRSADTQVADTVRSVVTAAIMDPVLLNDPNAKIPTGAGNVTINLSSGAVAGDANGLTNISATPFGDIVGEGLGFDDAADMIGARNSGGILDEIRSGVAAANCEIQITLTQNNRVNVAILGITDEGGDIYVPESARPAAPVVGP